MLTSFLTTLFDKGLVEVRAIAPVTAKTNVRVKRWFCSSVKEVVGKVEQHKQEYNLYFGVLPRIKPEGTKEAIAGGKVLWVDVDAKQVRGKENALKLIRLMAKDLQCVPSFLVDSGNGYHAYWLLDQWVTSEAIEFYGEWLADKCFADRCWDSTRILRLPGTLNLKDGQAKVCQVIEANASILPVSRLPLGPGKTSKGQKTDVSNLSLKDLIPPCSSFSFDNLPFIWQQYIVKGIAADTRNFYRGDRSSLDFAVIKALLEHGYDLPEIYSIFTDPANGISQKALEKPEKYRQAYLVKSIEKAKRLVG